MDAIRSRENEQNEQKEIFKKVIQAAKVKRFYLQLEKGEWRWREVGWFMKDLKLKSIRLGDWLNMGVKEGKESADAQSSGLDHWATACQDRSPKEHMKTLALGKK